MLSYPQMNVCTEKMMCEHFAGHEVGLAGNEMSVPTLYIIIYCQSVLKLVREKNKYKILFK